MTGRAGFGLPGTLQSIHDLAILAEWVVTLSTFRAGVRCSGSQGLAPSRYMAKEVLPRSAGLGAFGLQAYRAAYRRRGRSEGRLGEGARLDRITDRCLPNRS